MKALWIVAVFCAVAAGCGRGMAQGREDDFKDAPPELLGKYKQLDMEYAAAVATVSDAQLQAVVPVKARQDAETAVEAAAKALKDAKASGQGVAEDQAIRDAQAAFDAKAAAVMKTVKPAEDAERAVKEAQAAEDAATVELQQLERELSAAQYKAQMRREEEQAGKGFAVSVKLAGTGHFTATVLVEGAGGNSWFRYDRFPAVERVVTPEGAVFVRRAGKGWEATDPEDPWKSWRTGRPGKLTDVKQAAALDEMVAVAMAPLHPVAEPREGALVWSRVQAAEGEFQEGREFPVQGKVYANCIFMKREDGGAGVLLRDAWGVWNWQGKLTSLSMHYFYSPREMAPPAGPMGSTAEDLAARAVRDAQSRPRRVEATVIDFKTDARTRVAGLISGRDFDLSVISGGALAQRQIAVGGDYWTSADGGRTWQKQKETDRTYFNEVDLGDFDEIPQWPRQVEMEKADGGAGDGDDGELAWLRMNQPGSKGGSSLNYWVAMKGGKPVLRRVEMLGNGVTVCEAIDDVPQPGAARAQPVVLPPPGNPAAVPGPDAGELLAQALAAMKAAGTWRAELTVRVTLQGGNHVPGGRAGHATDWNVSGLITGDADDFDLAATNLEDGRVEHLVSWHGEERFRSTWGPVKWTSDGNRGTGPFPEAGWPLEKDDFAGLPCVVAGKEKRGGETLLHIRCIDIAHVHETAPEYRLALDGAGRPVAVRRCEWTHTEKDPNGHAALNSTSRTVVVYTKAKDGEKVEEPREEK